MAQIMELKMSGTKTNWIRVEKATEAKCENVIYA